MPQTDVERLSVLIEANTKSYERAMVRIERKTDKAVRQSTRAVSRLDKGLSAASKGAVTLGRSFAAAFGGTLALGGVAGLAGAVRGVTADMAKLAENADKVGLSVEDLQLVRLAGEEMGIAYGQADTAMQRFSRRIAEASTGAGELVKILRANNIELRDQQGNLRPQIEILKDYANLIQNAGSDQERLLLAFKAFDTEGAAFVNVLRDGASGLETVFKRQRELNNLFDEETVRALKDVDQSFADVSKTIETNFKRVIVGITKDVNTAVTSFDGFTDSLGQFLTKNLGFFETAKERSQGALSAMEKLRAAGLEVKKIDLSEFQKIKDGLSLDVAEGNGGTTKPTVVPGPTTKSSGRSASDRRAERIQNVVRALEFEAAQLRRTSDEQAVYNQLRSAGVELDSEAGQKIQGLTLHLEEAERRTRSLEKTQQASIRSAQFFGDVLTDGVRGLASGADKATDVVKRLAISLAEAALQAALLGQGPFGGAFGAPASGTSSGIGGIIGSFLKFLPGFATGGNFSVGGTGGTDSQLVAFRATPGERVSVTPPQTPQAGNGGGTLNIRFLSSEGREVEPRQSGTSGGRDVELFIEDIIVRKAAKRGTSLNQTLTSVFGLSNPLGAR